MNDLQIFRFKPILKSSIWGGRRIGKLKKISLPDDHIGESWEISGLLNNETTVAEGEFQGVSINELVSRLGVDLVGTHYNPDFKEFPILIKIIDAAQPLSLQVHPHSSEAGSGTISYGKNEIWYIADCKPHSRIYAGLTQNFSSNQIESLIENDSILNFVKEWKVTKGELYYVEAGTIHAIGQDCLIIEVQDASNITYRINDYERTDKDGKQRNLHKKEASKAIIPERNHTEIKYRAGRSVVTPKFKLSLLTLDEQSPKTLITDGTTFHILTAASGDFRITYSSGETELQTGETIMIPAKPYEYLISGTGSILDIFI